MRAVRIGTFAGCGGVPQNSHRARIPRGHARRVDDSNDTERTTHDKGEAETPSNTTPRHGHDAPTPPDTYQETEAGPQRQRVPEPTSSR